MKTRLLIPAIVCVSCLVGRADEICRLQTNHLHEPGHVEGRPTFGWQMKTPRKGAAQQAYRLRVFGDDSRIVWDSGVVRCDKSVGIRYEGAALESARNYAWSVAVQNEKGEWTREAKSSFSTGLLAAGDWDGTIWISPVQVRGTNLTTVAFCKTVRNAKKVKSAFWAVSGLGVFEAFVNGERFTQDIFKPGFTHQYKCHHAFTYDVTGNVKKEAGAENVFSAFSSRGWWLGRDDPSGYRTDRTSAFRAQLILRYEDGTEDRIGTDETWKAKYAGPVLDSTIFAGEKYDARISTEWQKTGRLDETWLNVVENKDQKGNVRNFPGSPVRTRFDLQRMPAAGYVVRGVEGASEAAHGRAVKVRDYKAGEAVTLEPGEELIVDFAQNMAGHTMWTFEGESGTSVVMRHGEWVNEGNGEKSRGCDGPGGTLYTVNLRRAFQRDEYVLKDGVQTYRQNFTYHGFRFASLKTTRKVKVLGVVALPVSSIGELQEASSFETNLPELNRLVQNACWTIRSNFFSVPTDCPQRCERLGWAADPMIVQKAATYQADVYAFYSKWMRDIVDTQGTNGCFAALGPLGKYSDPTDKGGWSDAGIVVPYRLWQQYGDLSVVRDNWDAMVTHLEFVNRTRYETAFGREWQWADWLSFEKLESCALGGGTGGWGRPTPDHNTYWDYLNQCWWMRDAKLMAKMATALGRKDDAMRFEGMAGDAREYLRKKYFTAEGGLIALFDDMQTPRLFALDLGLAATPAEEDRLRRELFADVEKNGGCLRTGLHGTSMILDTLTRNAKAPERAYDLLLQRKPPSWLFCVDQGATTIWERWDGYTKANGFATYGMNSYNHVAFGCVMAWMYDTMAGIREDEKQPGFKHFYLSPIPDKRVGEVKAVHVSPYGKIESRWKFENDGVWKWHFVIPPNTTATVSAPGIPAREYAAGTYELHMKHKK